ncbi:MAG: BamA/TamA family outer membrane protein [Candidatus Solibacter sp.]
MRSLPKYVFLAVSATIPLLAQADSRLAEIAARQDEKAANVQPDTPNKVERGMNWFRDEDPLRKFSAGLAGFRPKLGGLGAGTGFALGLEYLRSDLTPAHLTFRTAAQSTLRGDRKFDLQISAPRLGSDRLFADFYAVRHDYQRMNYYGPGHDSYKTGRTDFHLEDTAFDFTVGAHATKHLTAGVSTGYLFNNVGHGTDSRFASAETVYSPSQATGIDEQANYLRSGVFAQYDWRDRPGGPRHGGNYFAQFNDYRDRSLGRYNFRRLDLEAQQYVPILNDRRVFAFRAKSTLSDTPGGQTLPFYMQPSLGGAEDLRGYRPYRFRGDNLFLASAEYRWEVFSGLDMALFGDAGQVFNHKSELRIANMQSDIGFGFRFNQRNKTFLRLDVAFSHEGFQVWLKFNNVFKKGPVHTSSSLGDF